MPPYLNDFFGITFSNHESEKTKNSLEKPRNQAAELVNPHFDEILYYICIYRIYKSAF